MSENGSLPKTGDRGPGALMSFKTFLARRPHLVPAVIAAAMLFATMGKWPYGYYQVMRWIGCAAAVFTAYQGYATKHLWAACAFAFAAVLFNPIVPIHLARGTWQALDPAGALLFLVGIVLVRRPVKNDAQCQKERD